MPRAASRVVLLAVLTAANLFLASRANAQALILMFFGDKLSTEKFQSGINASAALTGFQGLRDKPSVSWSLGIYGEWKLNEQFHLQPELTLKTPGGGRHIRTSVAGYPFEQTYGEPTLDNLLEHGQVERHLTYITLPVLAKWVRGPFGLGVGPQFGILLKASDTVTMKTEGDTLSMSASISDAIRRWDMGFVATLEYAFWPRHKMRSMRVRALGYMGLADVVKDNPHRPMRNYWFQLGMDFPIGGPSKPPPKSPAK